MSAKGEFQTSKEARAMVRSLNKAAVYCTGENSSRQMSERIQDVEREAKRLEDKGC